MWRCLLLVVAVVSLSIATTGGSVTAPAYQRIAVEENHQNFSSTSRPMYLAFAVDGDSGKLASSSSVDGKTWSGWFSIPTLSPVTSNPVACVDNATAAIMLFAQGSDGQVYMYYQTSGSTFHGTKLTSNIPTKLSPPHFSPDAVKCLVVNKVTFVFARSQTNSSELYWSYSKGNSSQASGWSTWSVVADSGEYLAYDPFVAINTFVNRVEVFIVSLSGYLYHTWQNGETSFDGKWHKLGLFPPKFSSAPVVHDMGQSDFNGMLEVFVRDEDNTLRHIWQTTCDKVKNPWGPCTWGFEFHKLGGTPPADKSNRNPFSISRNIHLGIEVFAVNMSNLHLYHIWQLERDSSWSDWEDIGPLSSSSGFQSQPTIVLDQHGWWQAFALDGAGVVVRFTQSPLEFSLSTTSIAFSHNVTVSWAIPTDEATHKDWIGVYLSGAPGHAYVDYAYVQGTQNPLKDAVPRGKLNFTALLPNGNYDYRYMVNKEYDGVLQSSVSVYNSTTEPEWVQLYRGLARGLGSISTNIVKCVEDGNRTVEAFKLAFDAFENRQIINGLHLVAEGLEDLRDALVQCDETVIVQDLTKFIEDLISCTADACTKFVIDIGIEILILFENIYEIYGDILGAKNCFDIDAYEQAGVCIGRVTHACLKLE